MIWGLCNLLSDIYFHPHLTIIIFFVLYNPTPCLSQHNISLPMPVGLDRFLCTKSYTHVPVHECFMWSLVLVCTRIPSSESYLCVLVWCFFYFLLYIKLITRNCALKVEDSLTISSWWTCKYMYWYKYECILKCNTTQNMCM